MSNYTLALPAPRRLALSVSKVLERWALEPTVETQSLQDSAAYQQAMADRERYELDALRLQPLR
ncbi:MAG TPA: hypothetical protein H9830_15150 [Candidatus Agrococcus pullicola]|uniref:Uncharacterized protein n=1 Tax=Candidatus Agrococcus pullicola TaxID=2838429 RepID=A0A9D1YXX1_9MICO|nr:hypothetical protein [Candidatus Agrococcus pullicola]